MILPCPYRWDSLIVVKKLLTNCGSEVVDRLKNRGAPQRSLLPRFKVGAIAPVINKYSANRDG